jgi:hypothetical protein
MLVSVQEVADEERHQVTESLIYVRSTERSFVTRYSILTLFLLSLKGYGHQKAAQPAHAADALRAPRSVLFYNMVSCWQL